MPIDYARKLVELRASPADQARIDELADKCNEGLLRAEEREEYERYVQGANRTRTASRQSGT